MSRYPARTPIKSSAHVGGVAAVDRALLLLAAFQEGDRSLTLVELVERTQLVKSTTLRLLATLGHFSLVQRLDDGRYALGPGIARLHGVYASSFSLESEVMPVLRQLARKTSETAVFYIRQGNRRLALHRVESAQAIQSHVTVGDLVRLDRGSGGRVLAAFSGAKGPLYDKVRRDKFAALIGDRLPELAGIAAPVFQPGGKLAGALTLTMPAHRFRKPHIALVVKAARELTLKLGGEAIA